MIVHIGNEEVINGEDIIAVFSVPPLPRNANEQAAKYDFMAMLFSSGYKRKEGSKAVPLRIEQVKCAPEQCKSCILVARGDKHVLYQSTVSAATLQKRVSAFAK